MRIVAGTYKNRTLKAPKGLTTRPTSEKLRAALFNMIQHQVEGAVILDLFAGSGAMGLEALSRGASKAVFVDSHREAAQCIKENLSALQVGLQGEVWQGDVFDFLERCIKQGRVFDLIYADPPYDATRFFQGKKMSYSLRLLHLLDAGSVLKPGGRVFIEDSALSKELARDFERLKFISSRQFGRSNLLEFQA